MIHSGGHDRLKSRRAVFLHAGRLLWCILFFSWLVTGFVLFSAAHAQPPPATDANGPHAAKLHIDDAEYVHPFFEARGISGTVSVSRTDSRTINLQSRGLRLRLLSLPQTGLRFENVEIQGTVALDTITGDFTTEDLLLEVPDLGTLTLAATLGRESIHGDLRAEEMDFGKALAPFLPHKIGTPRVPAGLRIHFQKGSDGAWQARVNIRFAKASFHDPDYLYAGENLTGTVTVNASGKAGRFPVQLSLTTGIGDGEIVWNRFYLSFATHPFTSELNFRLETDGKIVRGSVNRGSARLKNLLHVRLDGSSCETFPDECEFRLRLPKQPVAPILDVFLKEAYGTMFPWLSEARWKGWIEARMRLAFGSKLNEAVGRLHLEDVDFEVQPRKISIHDLNFTLPVWYRRKPKTDAGTDAGSESAHASESLSGVLGWKDFRFSSLGFASLRLPLTAQLNGYRIAQKVLLRINGQRVLLGPGRLENVWSPDRSGTVEIQAEDLDLSNFLPESLGKIVRPKVRIPKQSLRLDRRRILFQKPLTIRIFGGTVTVHRLAVEKIFSPAPEILLDATWKDIDLERLTEATQFGRITGRLTGSVKNLRIAYGAPVSFDLVLKSQDQAPVQKKISIIAIDNLSQVGTSQSPFMGAAGLLKVFFKDFPYKKIGIRCTLENDYFTIRGLVREQGKEYLVKRGALHGVDVINQNPRNRIAWNDMIRRLKRIRKSGRPEMR